MKRKILMVLLMLCLSAAMLTLAGATGTTCSENCMDSTHVAAIGDTHYNSLADAVAAVHADTGESRMNDHTVTLLRDATGGGIPIGYETFDTSKGTTSGNSPVNVTIDLNGHTYTLTSPAVGSAGTETNGFQFLQGSKVTIQNGTITTELTKNIFQSYCELTLKDLTVNATACTTYVVSHNAGAAVLKNVTIDTNAVAIDLMHWESAASYNADRPSMTIDNGSANKIGGKIAVYCYNPGVDTCGTVPSLSITGGTFTDDPSAYCAAGYRATQNGDGTYTVSRIYYYYPVTTSTEPEEEPEGEAPGEPLPFADVPESSAYYDGIRFVYESGIMQGYTDESFDPSGAVTRGMLVEMLYRYAGSPAAEGENFSDVAAARYYADAVAWAAQNDLVNGFSDGSFSPDGEITRQQLAVILYRFAGYLGLDVSVGADTNLLSFTDATDISEYAMEAMQWACGAGLINGFTDGSLRPNEGADRGQTATILMRMLKNLK